jgi:integrase/recombinase XerC/integrase/recombinase XerD
VSGVPFLRPFSAFAAARDDYLLVLEQENRAPATVEKYRHAIARLERFAGPVDPATLDATLLRRWLVQLRAEGVSESTQRYYLNWIKTWLRWLAEEGGYGVEAAATVRAKPPRVIEEPIVPFSEAEIARLFADGDAQTFLGQRQRALVATLLDTGIRAAEIRGLRLCDLDLTAGEITVLPTTDKTRKGRTIGLGRRAKLELSRWWTRYRLAEGLDQSPTAALFIMTTGEPYNRRAFQLLITRLGRRAGVSNCHPHRFRHTFAILSLRHGMNPFVLMHSLGHKDMAMTKKYLDIVDSDVREQKRATSPFDRIKL